MVTNLPHTPQDSYEIYRGQALQGHAAGLACATAQVATLRERLLKVAVWVERSVRRIVLHLPTSFPWQPTWRQLARALGVTP